MIIEFSWDDRVRLSDILLARFVRCVIGRKGGREVSSLSHSLRKQGKLKKKIFRPAPFYTNLKEIKARHLGPSYWLKGK